MVKRVVGGAAAGGVGGARCAMCRAIAIQGATGSNYGWKRGTAKSLREKK